MDSSSRYVQLVVAFALGAAVWWAVSARFNVKQGVPQSLSIGSKVMVVRPTGGIVSGAGGGHPSPVQQHHSLTVYRTGKDISSNLYSELPSGSVIWRFTVNDETYFARED